MTQLPLDILVAMGGEWVPDAHGHFTPIAAPIIEQMEELCTRIAQRVQPRRRASPARTDESPQSGGSLEGALRQGRQSHWGHSVDGPGERQPQTHEAPLGSVHPQ